MIKQSVPVEEDFPPQGIKDSNRFKVLKSFVQLICCNCELVNGWETARNSAAKIFLDEEEEVMDDVQNGLAKTQQEIHQWTPVNAQYNIEGFWFLGIIYRGTIPVRRGVSAGGIVYSGQLLYWWELSNSEELSKMGTNTMGNILMGHPVFKLTNHVSLGIITRLLSFFLMRLGAWLTLVSREEVLLSSPLDREWKAAYSQRTACF
ncbi:hypothetical protein OS493_033503 [Desmophyllum pertusum]|uniref:Uncharacterized protein n=1 Tax=Desmophyllum pertusum TaxID=174260 RepID=A0A9W9Z849_9CNID|nr:hypothetical protein OS493_033503 [Desmophyllum pertusum]